MLASDNFQSPSISTHVFGVGAAVPRGVAIVTGALTVSPATVGSAGETSSANDLVSSSVVGAALTAASDVVTAAEKEL